MIITKNLLFGRSTDWWLRNPLPLDISFPPLSLNMNSLKQILEDVKIEGGSEKKGDLLTHGSYRWIIMLGKCGRPDLNVFHLKWILSYRKIGPNGLSWQCRLAGSLKTDLRI